MMRIGTAALLVVMILAPAAAQEVPRGFPVDQTFKTISISGFDVQKSVLTLTVTRDRAANQAKGAGSAGCNNWTAVFIFRDDTQMDVSDVVTTKKACPKPRMTTEDAFLTTLRSLHRWRTDGNKLILEGEAGRLLMTSGAVLGDKKPQKKSDKKPASRPQANR